MDPVAIHLVGREQAVQPLDQRLARNPDIHRDCLGAAIEPVEMAIEERDPPAMNAHPLPHPVAKHEP